MEKYYIVTANEIVSSQLHYDQYPVLCRAGSKLTIGKRDAQRLLRGEDVYLERCEGHGVYIGYTISRNDVKELNREITTKVIKTDKLI